FRIVCTRIITHKMFDHIVLLIIFLNCITIAMERPYISTVERIFLKLTNYIFTAIFVAEMFIKIVSLGWCFGDKSYLRSSWNLLDGMLVMISVIDILVSLLSNSGTKILGMLRVLRLLRTLRPLRVISRAPGLKLVVETLMSSLKPIGNIVVICCAFFIIFGILGVQLFKGKFFICQGEDIGNVTNKSDCLQANKKWVRHKYNFDNLGQALMSLFVLASKDGWVDIMYYGLDAVGVDQQPVMNYNPWMLLYFISFLLIVAFFVLNMFVGVVVENFHKCRRHQEAEEAKRREEKRLKRMEKKRRSKEKELADLLVPGWALSGGTLKGTEFPACSVFLLNSHTTTDHSTTMVAWVFSTMITGGRAPSREPPPCLPPISSQSAGHAVTCFLCRGFVSSQLFHTVRDPSSAPPAEEKTLVLVRLGGKVRGGDSGERE
ncbi:hypothetical protein KUCAC02_025004, partial [Chaenocephalus aceratus]